MQKKGLVLMKGIQVAIINRSFTEEKSPNRLENNVLLEICNSRPGSSIRDKILKNAKNYSEFENVDRNALALMMSMSSNIQIVCYSLQSECNNHLRTLFKVH